jgi:hypothetical protein
MIGVLNLALRLSIVYANMIHLALEAQEYYTDVFLGPTTCEGCLMW